MAPCCYQINLQRGFGGGEVYAATFARALARLGIESVLFVHPQARAWDRLNLDGVRLERIDEAAHLADRMRREPPAWLAFHTLAPADTIDSLKAQGHLATAFAHMPLYGRNAEPLRRFDRILAVSWHVIASLEAAGIRHFHPEPLYGVADLARATDSGGGVIRAHSCYDWDRRKFRDRLLGVLEPAWRPLLPARRFVRRPGITLGVVSRLTPIKQFPLLFSHLAPVLRRHPAVNLEIFGSGGYASVRDLRRALAPVAGRTRFWGQQSDVAAVYRQLDALLTGLPEKEALGLNVLEAQACGTPVLAPDAPPFDETVLDGITGLRYRDPREDHGVGFERALCRLREGEFRFDTERAQAHLAQFSTEAFVERTRRLAEAVRPQSTAVCRATETAPGSAYGDLPERSR